MNKFLLYPCIIHKGKNENGYTGPLATLVSTNNDKLTLFFPISEDNASLINFSLKKENRSKINIHQDVIGVYKTMVDSWKSDNKHISGIVLDAKYSSEATEEIIEASIILIDANGDLDTMVKTNMVHAIIVAAIENLSVYVSNDLFSKLVPPDDPEDIEDLDDDNEDSFGDDGSDEETPPTMPKDGAILMQSPHFPVDKDLVKIVKQIMDKKSEDT